MVNTDVRMCLALSTRHPEGGNLPVVWIFAFCLYHTVTIWMWEGYSVQWECGRGTHCNGDVGGVLGTIIN